MIIADLSSCDARTRLAKMITKLFDQWGLSRQDRCELLDLAPKSRALTLYAKGHPVENRRDQLDRVGLLLSIYADLRLLYPHNPDLRYTWVTKRNTVFGRLTPLDVMKEEGVIGLAKVARYLDSYTRN